MAKNINNKEKTWKAKLDEWESGHPLTYPKKITKRFFYETKVCTKDLDTPYESKYIPDSRLEYLENYHSSFNTHLKSSTSKYVTKFPNLAGDSILIIPIPKKGKNFTTIKDFIDNASTTQQIEFWRYVSKSIKDVLEKNDKIYVSTHGLGVPYFHLRLDTRPKYYQTQEYKK